MRAWSVHERQRGKAVVEWSPAMREGLQRTPKPILLLLLLLLSLLLLLPPAVVRSLLAAPTSSAAVLGCAARVRTVQVSNRS